VFSGLIWGAVVAVAGAGGLSLAYPDFKPSSAMVEVVAKTDAVPAEPEAMDQADQMSDEATEMVADIATTPVDAPKIDDAMAMSEEASEETADVVEPVVVAKEVAEADAEIAEPLVMVAEVAEPEVVVSEVTVPDAVESDADVTEPEVTETAEADVVVEPDVIASEITPEAQPEPEIVTPAIDPAPSITDEIIAALPKPEGTFGNLAPQVKTDRLPSLADEEEPAEDATSAVAPPPIVRFAAEFTADEDKPLMAIVLMDEGETSLGVEALAAFPYPLTFAVNASLPNAAERMKVYRDKGFEVVALAGLPQGATASDTEVAMAAYMSAVPEAVAILETPDVSLQSSREITDQLTKIVLESGHGLVLQANGLNTAQKLARREGIPSATVFRDFDGKDQKAGVIRRFLDQAAFKAGQEGGVIMLGRLRAETISALLIWGLADRADRVALVPVSAVLQKGNFTR
jgi:polysaccharide deacetylase 2 family uncharacterized protein YibQ